MELDDRLRKRGFAQSTEWAYANSLRYLLRWMWESHGAPKLDQHIGRRTMPRPRAVTISTITLETVLEDASEGMRLWLLLCADLGIRSGTAARLRPENYDRTSQQLMFRTKFGTWQRLPVTDEIAAVLEPLNHRTEQSYVSQLKPRVQERWVREALYYELACICKAHGMNKTLHPHDLRRTLAVKVYEHTGDLRTVQSLLGHRNITHTLWYLDHETQPIRKNTLELVKGNKTWKEERKLA